MQCLLVYHSDLKDPQSDMGDALRDLLGDQYTRKSMSITGF